jgi:catechol 2,3-dioxygenase-like lactoylglutathione lyase family enzyme
MRVAAALQWLLMLSLLTLPQASAAPPVLRFHHLHLRDNPPAFRIGYYEKLFEPSATKRTTFAGADGLQMGSRLILVSQTTSVKELPAALWHFGWGQASLGESYLTHARREVAWEPPLPPEGLHVHLRSVSPSAAAAWYRDVLGARVELPRVRTQSPDPLPAPEHRRPEALVHIGGMPLLVYRADPPLVSSAGQPIDHLAFACDDLPGTLAYLKSMSVVILSDVMETHGARTAMIKGPDQIALELVESR